MPSWRGRKSPATVVEIPAEGIVSPRRSMDRISPSEGDDASSIPAEGTI